jgi:hypothetical protein
VERYPMILTDAAGSVRLHCPGAALKNNGPSFLIILHHVSGERDLDLAQR